MLVEGVVSKVMDILVDGNDELCSHTGSLNLSPYEAPPVPIFMLNPPKNGDDRASGKSKS